MMFSYELNPRVSVMLSGLSILYMIWTIRFFKYFSVACFYDCTGRGIALPPALLAALVLAAALASAASE